MTTSESAKIIKATLNKLFDFERLSVSKGKGTARHWIYINADLKRSLKPEIAGDSILGHSYCTCEDTPGFCSNCQSRLRITDRQIEEAIKSSGAEVSTWSDDFGTINDCLLITVKII